MIYRTDDNELQFISAESRSCVLPSNHVEGAEAAHPAVIRVPHAWWQAHRCRATAKGRASVRATPQAATALAAQLAARDSSRRTGRRRTPPAIRVSRDTARVAGNDAPLVFIRRSR